MRKDWTPFCPTDGDRQESQSAPIVETNGCMAFANVHCAEIQEREIFGFENDYSEQAVYVLSGTNPKTGNDATTVVNAIKNYGLIKTSILPEPVNFTLAQFTAPIDPKIVATGQQWLNQRTIESGSIASNGGQPLTDLTPALNCLNDFPPLITIDLNVDSTGPNDHQFHEVVLLNDKGDYFDSYGQLIKNLGSLKVYYVNKLKIKFKNMNPIYKLQGSATLYFAVGTILIPFATDYAIYLQNFANSPVIELTQAQFNQFTIATKLAVKSL